MKLSGKTVCIYNFRFLRLYAYTFKAFKVFLTTFLYGKTVWGGILAYVLSGIAPAEQAWIPIKKNLEFINSAKIQAELQIPLNYSANIPPNWGNSISA
jgi:hypothetical protein